MPSQHRDNPITRDILYRVYILDERLHERITEYRKKAGIKLRELVQMAVERELPILVGKLKELLPDLNGGRRPHRLPITEELLSELRKASNETDIPATRLLVLCLDRATRKRRGRPRKEKSE